MIMNHKHRIQEDESPFEPEEEGLSFTPAEHQLSQGSANHSLTFGSTPVSIKCPFCLQQTKTEVIAKPELVSIVLGLVLFSLIPNAIMIIVTVVVLQLTATKKHRCALCERQLGTDGKFLLIFTDEVYSFSFGETGILISKKILITIALFLSVFLVISIRANRQEEIIWSDYTWDRLRVECPLDTINPKCLSETQGSTVKNWVGYVMRVEDERQSMKRFYEHAIKIFIKMDPQQQSSHHPDIVLTGTTSIIYLYSEVLDNLRHGDQVVFNATFWKSKTEADVPTTRHLHLVGINSTGLHSDRVQVYVKVEEEDWVENRVEGHGLRIEKDGVVQEAIQVENQQQKNEEKNTETGNQQNSAQQQNNNKAD